MPDRKKVISELEYCRNNQKCNDCESCQRGGRAIMTCESLVDDALTLLKEQENLLGIHQTADGITFISSGTAKQGEDRGIMLGKAYMHEWLQKELLYRGLMTNEIRKVFADARSL